MAFEGKLALSFDVAGAGGAGPRDEIIAANGAERRAAVAHADTCFILVSLPTEVLARRAAAMGFDVARLRPAEGQHNDSQIVQIVTALAFVANDAGEAQSLIRERLVDALCARLIAPSTEARDAAAQTLSPPQKRRVAEFIDGRLADKLSLSQIAKVARVSPSHLKVLFRRTFGVPVHQYIIRRRVERAVALIEEGAGPMSDVAAAAGFAHQSHLSRCMKRVLGTTPAALARRVR